MKTLAERGGLKNNGNCAYPSMPEWRMITCMNANLIACFLYAFIMFWFSLSLSAWMMEFVLFFFIFYLLLRCVVCLYYLRFTIKCYHTDSMAVSTVRHFQCFIWIVCDGTFASAKLLHIFISERTREKKHTPKEDIWCLAIETRTNEKERERERGRKMVGREQHYHHHHHHHFRFYGCERFFHS